MSKAPCFWDPDEHIREYLRFRGLTSTLKSFTEEPKAKENKTEVDKFVDLYIRLVKTCGVNTLRVTWSHFNQRVVSNFQQGFAQGIFYQYLTAGLKIMETSLYQFFLVNLIGRNDRNKVNEFCTKMGPELQNQPEWRDWLNLPAIEKPEDHIAFADYFRKPWQDNFIGSFHKFFSSMVPVDVLDDFSFNALKNLSSSQSPPARSSLLTVEPQQPPSQPRSLQPIEPTTQVNVQPVEIRSPENLQVNQSSVKFSPLLEAQDTIKPTESHKLPNAAQKPSPVDDHLQKKAPVKPDESHNKSSLKRFLCFKSMKSKSSPEPSQSEPYQLKNDRTNFAPMESNPPTNVDDLPAQGHLPMDTPLNRRAMISSPDNTNLFAPHSSTNEPAKPSTVKSHPPTNAPKTVEFSPATTAPAVLPVERHSFLSGIFNPLPDKHQPLISEPDKPLSVDQPGNIEHNSPTKSQMPPMATQYCKTCKLPIPAINPASAPDDNSAKKKGFLCFKNSPPKNPPGPPLPDVSRLPDTKIERFTILDQKIFNDHRAEVIQCKFNADGSLAASCDVNGFLRTWTNDQLLSIYNCEQYSPGSPSLCWIRLYDFCTVFDNVFRLHYFNPYTGFYYQKTCGTPESLYNSKILSYFSDSVESTLACSGINSEGSEGELFLYDLNANKIKQSFTLGDDKNPIAATCCEFIQDGNILVIGCTDGLVRSLDHRSGIHVTSWAGHSGGVCALQVTENICYSFGVDHRVHGYDLVGYQDPKLNITVPGCHTIHGAQSFAINQSKNLLLTACGHSGAKLYKIIDGDIRLMLSLRGHRSTLTTCDWSFSDQQATILSSSSDGVVAASKVFVL